MESPSAVSRRPSARLELERLELYEGAFFAGLRQRHRVLWAVVRGLWRLLRLGDPALTECRAVLRRLG